MSVCEIWNDKQIMDEKEMETQENPEENGSSTASEARMVSNGQKQPKRRRRMKSYFKEVIQQMESLLLGSGNRRPSWLTELASGNDDQWFPTQAIVARLTSADGKIDIDVGASKGFVALLKESKLLEVNADGSNVRAKATGSVSGVPSRPDCVLYVDNLPGRANDEWLTKVFTPYGRLIDAWVIKPRNKSAVKARQREEEERKSGATKLTPNCHRKNKGFGFVHFAEPSTVEQLLKRFRGGNPGQASSKIRRSKSREQKTPSLPPGPDSRQPSTSNLIQAEVSQSASPSTSTIQKEDNASSLGTIDSTNQKRKLCGFGRVPSNTVLIDNATPSSPSKQKNTGQVESEEPSTKRSRANEKVDQSLEGLCNGHLDTDCNSDIEISGSVEAGPSSVAKKKRKRRKRKSQARHEMERHHLHEQATSDNVVSSLRVYSWSEWNACKKAYLEQQKQSYSNLKSELKQLKNEGKVADVLLKRKDRYRDGKELRGRDKMALKAEAVLERRIQSSANTKVQDDQR